ncbi:glycosyltransferase family 2 protein [Rubripirellula reticaptiva]|uniref:4,4'-diaponeurosporenoate glycosyltransferase n=1 Tax=Rubripirellula reticaptiva TaxID=2528013 RepID=A0A5C6EH11_9BACT|nr:glycosyltransferase family A protein [Rubripirellula reticaptiva]TWU46886.1 4,4'-diaponeurosporenoate glycosyltransferase [Rubripirellula reticaptiva]
MIVALSLIALVIAMIPMAMFSKNLPLFCDRADALLDRSALNPVQVSVLIPARDEEAAIAKCVSAALASRDVAMEVIVLDDHSTDRTAEVVHELGVADDRVQLITGNPLPSGWNGKQHACFQLAESAKFDRLVFLDADVRLSPEAIAIMAAYQDNKRVHLLSAFPHQETQTWLEKLIIPMMHFILLGFLPLHRMRASTHPSYAAGCGQLFMTTKAAYQRAGTHESIKGSRHDGIKLPRSFRGVGMCTDVIDGTNLAECRMYGNAYEVVQGVLKNASEGIASPTLIVPFTLLLIGSSVLPVAMLIVSLLTHKPIAILISVFAVVIGHMPRAMAAKSFRQPVLGIFLHSFATLIFVSLQWVAFGNSLLGRKVAWRGRV